MKLLDSTKKIIDKTNNRDNISSLEVVKELFYYNAVENQY